MAEYALTLEQSKTTKNASLNKLEETDKAFHDWYRFVLSYPAHLVRDYIRKFKIAPGQRVLDPFSGTGTTIVESRLNQIESIGIEANLIAHFANEVKVNWDIDTVRMRQAVEQISERHRKVLKRQGIDDQNLFEETPYSLDLLEFPDKQQSLFIKNSISPIPLHKSIHLLRQIEPLSEEAFFPHLKLALAKALVFSISNLRFGPEVGVGKVKIDTPVLDPWKAEVATIADDIDSVRNMVFPSAHTILGDSRNSGGEIAEHSIDAIITSPPYPNEKDYSRTTRLETVFFGFVKNNKELRALKKSFVRSNTRGVYVSDTDDEFIRNNSEVMRLAKKIEDRRVELGKTSGFEKRYAMVTKQYFGGMARHLEQMKKYLKPGAKLAYVVGDQASYLRVMIRTGQLLATIAEDLGYQVDGIDLFRTRFATATQEDLREEVVLLRWRG